MSKSRFFVVIVALVVLSSAAVADGYEYEPVGQSIAPPPVYSWTGPYVGVHGGYAWQDGFLLFDSGGDQSGPTGPRFPFDLEGGIVGLQAGYRAQWGQFVVGVEGDYSARPGGDQDLISDPPPASTDTEFIDIESKYLASLRGKAGYLIGNVLVFGTVGVGFTEYELSVNDPGSTSANASVSKDYNEEGVVYGGGIEVAIGTNVSLGAEYLHYDVGTRINIRDDEFNDADENDFLRFDDVDVVRASLNIQLTPRSEVAPLK